jgi:GGDEF domain-containing protein
VAVDASALRPGLLPLWVGRIRAQLRAGDFAGALSDREIAVLLCGASADQTARVSARLTHMFTTEDGTGALPYSAIGMTTRSPQSSFEGSIVGAARAQASRH